MRLALIGFACALATAGTPAFAGQPSSTSATAIDRAFGRMYNLDFPGAHAILDDEARVAPDDPLVHSVRAAALLFAEFDRLRILESEFFSDDEVITDRKRVKPDPIVRERLMQETALARRLAHARLAANRGDREALFALSMAAGIETDYVALVEKRYLRAYSLSKEAQVHARRLLAMTPPFYDARLTLGTAEYVVANLNFFFRLFVRFDQIEGSRTRAIEELGQVVTSGRYFPPFAKILLSAIHLRENRLPRALELMQQLATDFPENRLIRREIARAEARVRPAGATARRDR